MQSGGFPLPGEQNRGKEYGRYKVIIIWLIVGGIAGWLAGMVVKGGGFGLIGDIVVGIIGALIAGWLLPQLGIIHRQRIYRRHHQCLYRRGDPVDHSTADPARLTGR